MGIHGRSASIQVLGLCARAVLCFALIDQAPEKHHGSSVGFLKSPPYRDRVLGCVDIVPARQAANGGVVELVVDDGTTPVLYSVLDGCDDDDDYQRNGRQAGICYTKDVKSLQGSHVSEGVSFAEGVAGRIKIYSRRE